MSTEPKILEKFQDRGTLHKALHEYREQYEPSMKDSDITKAMEIAKSFFPNTGLISGDASLSDDDVKENILQKAKEHLKNGKGIVFQTADGGSKHGNSPSQR